MTFKVLYFAHITALALWLGALVSVAWWTWAAARAEHPSQRAWGLRMTHTLSNWVINPGALIVLAAGLAMIFVGGWVGVDKPLWLTIMEMGGGTLVLASLGLVTWLSRRVRREADAPAPAGRSGVITAYLGTLSVLGVAVLGVLLVVSLRVA